MLGIQVLLVVNRAYSLYDKDIGYCQGMNFIVAGKLQPPAVEKRGKV